MQEVLAHISVFEFVNNLILIKEGNWSMILSSAFILVTLSCRSVAALSRTATLVHCCRTATLAHCWVASFWNWKWIFSFCKTLLTPGPSQAFLSWLSCDNYFIINAASYTLKLLFHWSPRDRLTQWLDSDGVVIVDICWLHSDYMYTVTVQLLCSHCA